MVKSLLSMMTIRATTRNTSEKVSKTQRCLILGMKRNSFQNSSSTTILLCRNNAQVLQVVITVLLLVDILSFLHSNMKSLTVPCGKDRLFSHCQLHYLFSINLEKQKCSSYTREPCTQGDSLLLSSYW